MCHLKCVVVSYAFWIYIYIVLLEVIFILTTALLKYVITCNYEDMLQRILFLACVRLKKEKSTLDAMRVCCGTRTTEHFGPGG